MGLMRGLCKGKMWSGGWPRWSWILRYVRSFGEGLDNLKSIEVVSLEVLEVVGSLECWVSDTYLFKGIVYPVTRRNKYIYSWVSFDLASWPVILLTFDFTMAEYLSYLESSMGITLDQSFTDLDNFLLKEWRKTKDAFLELLCNLKSQLPEQTYEHVLVICQKKFDFSFREKIIKGSRIL